jgi:two-component system, NtrC family, sensor kinase
MIQPVSEDKNVEDATQQLIYWRELAERSERLAAVGELAGTTAHEFNNLLMTILNYAKLGLRHRDEATRDKALQKIYDASQRAARVTQSVMGMARNRTGGLEPTQLQPVIEDALLLLEREMKSFRVQVETRFEPVPDVLAAGNDIQRLLLNLLINARQAMPDGGRITLQLKPEAARRNVLLVVRDEGHGMAPEVMQRIFEPLFSTKSGPDQSGKGGCGLGLSTCQRIVDAHRGTIRVRSSLGKGTEFTIRLPVAEQ